MILGPDFVMALIIGMIIMFTSVGLGAVFSLAAFIRGLKLHDRNRIIVAGCLFGLNIINIYVSMRWQEYGAYGFIYLDSMIIVASAWCLFMSKKHKKISRQSRYLLMLVFAVATVGLNTMSGYITEQHYNAKVSAQHDKALVNLKALGVTYYLPLEALSSQYKDNDVSFHNFDLYESVKIDTHPGKIIFINTERQELPKTDCVSYALSHEEQDPDSDQILCKKMRVGSMDVWYQLHRNGYIYLDNIKVGATLIRFDDYDYRNLGEVRDFVNSLRKVSPEQILDVSQVY